MPTPAAQVFLEAALKDLERLRDNANLLGDDVALFAYILDMAIVEGRKTLDQ